MSVIDKVEIRRFSIDVPDFTHDFADDSIAGSLTYEPGKAAQRQALMVRVSTEDGCSGEYAYWTTAGSYEQAIQSARVAIGREWQHRERIYRVARRQARPKHAYGLSWIDMALWDLAGNAHGASLTELLGGWRGTIPAYASTNNGDRFGNLSSKEDVADFMLSLQKLGMRGFKMHSWHDGDKWEEAENVLNMRATLGDRAELMIDPACVFDSVSDAIFVGKACEEARFRWFEDPLRPMGIGAFAHRQLRDALDIPILQTEHIPGPEAKADFLLAGGTDILRVDAHYDLGVTGALKTIGFAESLGVNVEMHAPSPVHRHLIAAMQNTAMYEMANVSSIRTDPSPEIYTCGYNDDVTKINADGTVDVPSGPGIGVSYDHDLIESRTTASETVLLERK